MYSNRRLTDESLRSPGLRSESRYHNILLLTTRYIEILDRGIVNKAHKLIHMVTSVTMKTTMKVLLNI